MLSKNFITWHTKARSYPCSTSLVVQHIPRRCFGASRNIQNNARPRDDEISGNGGGHKRGVFMGTVAARTASPANLEELLSHIKPEPLGKPHRSNEAPSLLALLVTPSFAKYALNSDLPLKVLQRFHANPTSSKPLDAIVAVVDRLPVPGNVPGGVEGIGYALVTDPMRSHFDSQVSLQPNASKPGSLTFDMSPASSKDPRHISAQMPLAQTIFSTGLPSTLIYTRYQFDPLSGQLRRQASQQLESATLPIPDSITKGAVKLTAPLLPLTLPRVVVSSMGNIVRKLSPLPVAQENKSSTVFSASQELEAAVSKYFEMKDMSPEPVQVWALLIPQHESKTYARKSIGKGGLLDAFAAGARLCKVLSGGGGWGKKAGLLSLDPDSQYSTRELRGDQGWDFNFEGDTTEEMMAAGRKQALGEIVKEGEKIVFCLLESKGHSQTLDTNTSELPPAIVLGALPPSTENEQSSTGSPEAPDDMPSLAHYPWHFGALCEGGMALNMSHQGKQLTQTKADAPYTTLTAYCLSQEEKHE